MFMFPGIPHVTDHKGNLASPLKFLAIGLVLCGPAAELLAAASMDGRYSGQFNGQPAQASVSMQQTALRGTLDIGGYVYRLEATRKGDGAEGRMLDQDGVAVPLSMALKGQDLRLRVYVQGALAPPLELVLTREARGGARAPAAAAQAPAGQIDPVLVGPWVKTQSYTSGDFSAASETRVTLFANGTYQYGPGRVVGGGNAGSFDTGAGGASGAGGRWRTENRILYTQEAGSGWTPYARYYVEGDSLMLTFGNGKREIWNRR
jgi:hypothetical protein